MTDSIVPLVPGFVLDRFRIDRVIASAASSIIYRVTDTATGGPFMLCEYVAPSCVVRTAGGVLEGRNQSAADAAAAGTARFLADGARAATLRHRGIATISRWFRANGTAYLVMPWQPGVSLASMMRGRSLDAPEALGIAQALMDALEYLHSRGILCLVMDPGLIIVSETGGPVLLGAGVFATQQNEDGPVFGADDPTYAAIEQLKPGFESGPWTDIYRLAAILRHCSEGAAPPTALQRWEAVQSGRPDPLPEFVAADGSKANRDIGALIARGLALEPAARPQNIREWRARISPVGPVAEEQHRPGSRRNSGENARKPPGMVLALFLVVIAAVAIYLLFQRTTDVKGGKETISGQAPMASRISAEETERWRQALEANAVIGYRKFMEDFPQSVHLQQAKEHIDLLEDKAWQQALEENSKAGYESHLSEFPEGRHATEALAKIEEINQREARLARARDAKMREDDDDWERAKAAGNLAGVDEYISAWPGGAHIREAHELRKALQYQINDAAGFGVAAKENTIAAYRSYMGDFPHGRHVSAAQQAIEDLTLRPGKIFRDCDGCPQMVVVPAGAFWQGSAEGSSLALSIEKPRRRVVIADPFAAGIHEVTMAQWDACVSAGACDTRPSDNGWGRGSRPVMMVSWNDAMQYVEWISKKTGQAYGLPSESQWEYVARAGEESDWLGGETTTVCQYGNIAGSETDFDWRHKDCSDGTALATMPAGSYRANAFGLFDVIGNVAEWTLDCMNLSYLEAPTDGSAWTRGMCSSRMTRGGSWFTGAKESRLSARFNLKNGDRNDFTGFRLVRRVEKQ